MGVTINVNGLSLVHKGSGGVAMATVPDVCKTPSPGGPVPVPYPNIARSASLAKGSTTVKVDGGNSAANKGSEFSTSSGDEAGTLGGVKSGVNMKEATWLTYSMDVKIEGKNAARLTDKMLMNHGNTVCASGIVQIVIQLLGLGMAGAALCKIICYCKDNPAPSKEGRSGYQQCVENQLNSVDGAMGGLSPMKPEVPYNMLSTPPSPISRHWMFHDHLKPMRPGATAYVPGDVRVPDVVLLKNPALPATQDNLTGVFEIKFKNDPWDSADMQRRRSDYRTIAGRNASYIELDEQSCDCDEPEPEPKPVPVPELEVLDVLAALLVLAAVLTPVPGDEVAAGVAVGARASRLLRFLQLAQ